MELGLNEIALLECLSGVASIKNVSVPGKPRALITFTNGREFLVAIDGVGRLTTTYMLKDSLSSSVTTDPFLTFDEVISHLSKMSVKPFSHAVKWLPIQIA